MRSHDMASDDDEQREGSPQKGRILARSLTATPKKRAALAAALRANIARRKARERALRESAQRSTGGLENRQRGVMDKIKIVGGTGLMA